jgi:hypothetical protein
MTPEVPVREEDDRKVRVLPVVLNVDSEAGNGDVEREQRQRTTRGLGTWPAGTDVWVDHFARSVGAEGRASPPPSVPRKPPLLRET